MQLMEDLAEAAPPCFDARVAGFVDAACWGGGPLTAAEVTLYAATEASYQRPADLLADVQRIWRDGHLDPKDTEMLRGYVDRIPVASTA